jgi:hypothetical protein
VRQADDHRAWSLTPLWERAELNWGLLLSLTFQLGLVAGV